MLISTIGMQSATTRISSRAMRNVSYFKTERRGHLAVNGED